jgi:Lon protease-like protein
MHPIPLLPLPTALLPGAPMPLHIFEPRYRQMIAHCIEGDGRFALVYHDPDESGPFQVAAQVGCMAEIREFQPIPDGRSTILVEGRERIKLTEEAASEGMYYKALVETFEDLDANPPGIHERRNVSIKLFQRTMTGIEISPSAIPEIDDTRDVSFQIARWIHTAPQWHQRLLESRSEVERLEQIDVLLLDALEQLS